MWLPDRNASRDHRRRSYVALTTLMVVTATMIHMIATTAFGVYGSPVGNIARGVMVILVVYQALTILLKQVALTENRYRRFLITAAISVINLLFALTGTFERFS